MKRIWKITSLGLTALASLGVVACGTANTVSTSSTPPSSGLTTVTVASDNAPAQAGIILADKLGYFKQQGIQIQYKTFASGEDELTALSAGQVDVARGVVSAGLFNAMEQGINVKIVADGGQNQPQKPYFEIVVRKQLADKVQNYSDLKGLKIGIASQGTINELFLARALAKGGLTLKDVHEVVVDSFPDLNTALANGAIDAAVQIEPLITTGVQKGFLSWWKNPVDYAPNEPVSIIEYGQRLLDNRSLGDHFMTAYLQGVRAYDNALIFGDKDQARIIRLMAGNTFVSDPTEWTQMNNPYLDPNGALPANGILLDLQLYVSEGETQTADPSKFVDMVYVNDALKQIGTVSH